MKFCNFNLFVIVQCTTTAAPDNGMRTPNTASTAVDAMLTMSCDSGYALLGETTATCTDQLGGTGADFDTDLSPTTCGKFKATPTSNTLKQKRLSIMYAYYLWKYTIFLDLNNYLI